MKTKYLLLYIILFSQLSLSAQSIRGSILDEHNSPVPFAHIVIQGTYEGTISNAEGRFVIFTKFENPRLEVSCIGFQKKLVPVSGRNHVVIKLSPEKKILNEVVIQPKNHALKLLKAAINSIPKNYPDTVEQLTAFVRQSARSPLDRSPFYEIELSLGIIKKGYNQPGKREGTAKILQSRKLEFQRMDSLAIRFYGGAHLPFWGDAVARRLGPLGFSKIDGYWLDVADTLVYDGKRLFEVRFEPIPKSSVIGSGSVFIQDSSYAITRFVIDYDEKECAGFTEDLLSPLRNFKRKYSGYSINYANYQDAWRLLDIDYKTGFDKEKVPYLTLEDQLIITRVDSVIQDIPYVETIGFHDITIDKVGAYDSTFWDGQNTLLPSQDFQNMMEIHQIRDTLRSQTKHERIFDFLKRLYSNYSFGGTSLGIHSTDVSHSLVKIKTEQESGQVFFQNIGVGLLINDHWAIEGTSRASFVASTFSGLWLSLVYQWNLNPNERPVRLKPNLGIGYQQWMNHLQKINSSETFEVKSKKFRSENVDVYLAERSLSILPGVKLSVEKSRRWSFYLSASRNFSFFPNKGLYFSEDKFFGKTAFLKSSDSSVSIQTSSDWIFNNEWQFVVGATLKY